jgi:hypothetical protein
VVTADFYRDHFVCLDWCGSPPSSEPQSRVPSSPT